MIGAVSFSSQSSRDRLQAAVEAVEAVSRAEVVIAVRAQARDYLGRDLAVGCAFGMAALAFQLYSSFVFELHWILLMPAAVILAATMGLRAVPILRRLYLPEPLMALAVRDAAASVFFERGVRHTRERTGVLVFVSLLERRVEVLADSGVLGEVPEDEWEAATAPLRRALDKEDGASTAGALAEAIEGLASVLGEHCERREDDVNELADVVDLGGPEASEPEASEPEAGEPEAGGAER